MNPRDLWSRFKTRAFVLESLATHRERCGGERGLRRVLNAFDLLMFGIGGIVGAGVFVLTGEAAQKYAGPGVVVSYGVAAVVAVLTGLCYAEFATDLPVAGGAYNYVLLAFGEFLAWIAAMNLFLEYGLTSSTIAKGFTGYFSTLCGLRSDALIQTFSLVPWMSIDVPAFLLTFMLSVVLALGVRESSTLNIVITSVNLASIFFVVVMSFRFFKTQNMEPFFPFGPPGVFRAASIVFFSYIGYDGVCSAAEEAVNPTRDLPIGIVGSLFIVTILYVLMALGITGMKKYTVIDINAPFSIAFSDVGMAWAGTIVSIGAVMGIVTSLLLTLLAMTRIFMALGNDNALPPWIARINSHFGTPVNATIVTGLVSGLPALFLDIEILANMVSIGTLFVLCMVCLGTLWRQYFKAPGGGTPVRPIIIRLTVLIVTAVLEGMATENEWGVGIWGISVGIWLATTLSFYLLPVVYTSDSFQTPLKPITPSLGVLFTIHLMGSLGWQAFVCFTSWQIIGVLVYFFYVIHTPDPKSDCSDVEEPILMQDDSDPSDAETHRIEPLRVVAP